MSFDLSKHLGAKKIVVISEHEEGLMYQSCGMTDIELIGIHEFYRVQAVIRAGKTSEKLLKDKPIAAEEARITP